MVYLVFVRILVNGEEGKGKGKGKETLLISCLVAHIKGARITYRL